MPLWYGAQPAWWAPLERDARRHFGDSLQHTYDRGTLTFDDALCLWYPLDPEERRWTSSKGLLDLIETVRTHLFLEHYWRLTGGEQGGQWLVEDAPHGMLESAWRSSRRHRRRTAAGPGPRPPH